MTFSPTKQRRSLWFDDLSVGMGWVTPARTVTEADIVTFAGLSGDYSSIHTDDTFARQGQFGQRIAYGMLVLAITTGLRARLGLFDESLIAFLGFDDWRFTRPVFIGDTVRCESEVVALRPSSKPKRGVVTTAMRVLNQHDEIVQEGQTALLIKRAIGDDLDG